MVDVYNINKFYVQENDELFIFVIICFVQNRSFMLYSVLMVVNSKTIAMTCRIRNNTQSWNSHSWILFKYYFNNIYLQRIIEKDNQCTTSWSSTTKAKYIYFLLYSSYLEQYCISRLHPLSCIMFSWLTLLGYGSDCVDRG